MTVRNSEKFLPTARRVEVLFSSVVAQKSSDISEHFATQCRVACVPRTGFEPVISTLKGWRPGPLDERGVPDIVPNVEAKVKQSYTAVVMEKVRPHRPDWFDGCWTEAIQLSGRSHSVLESALGLGRLIDDGDVVEARRVYRDQLQPEIIRMRMSVVAEGEKDSTQLQMMILSGMYPADLCEQISSLFEADNEE